MFYAQPHTCQTFPITSKHLKVSIRHWNCLSKTHTLKHLKSRRSGGGGGGGGHPRWRQNVWGWGERVGRGHSRLTLFHKSGNGRRSAPWQTFWVAYTHWRVFTAKHLFSIFPAFLYWQQVFFCFVFPTSAEQSDIAEFCRWGDNSHAWRTPTDAACVECKMHKTLLLWDKFVIRTAETIVALHQ